MPAPPFRPYRLCLALAASSLLALAPLAAAQVQTKPWVDIDGNPLPFQDDAAIEDFLAGAEIVDDEKVPVGTTGPRHLTLERNGVRVAAVFRDVDETHSRVRLSDGSYFQALRDYAGFEVAAYRISRMLAMNNVPAAVHRTWKRSDGTLQIWVEGAMMEGDRVEDGLRSPDGLGWGRQVQEMLAFDELVGNVDRNPGNLLIDEEWRVWLIDHTRAFQQAAELRNAARIRMVRREFWEAIKSLDKAAVGAAVRPHVDSDGLDNMFARRDLLVAHLQGLIDQRGEGAVVWE
jgi:hypothetical protein